METATLLKAENVSKRYNRNIILNGINLSVKKGECIALVGENGCGKSTLLRILSNVTRPTSGKIVASSKLRLGLIPDRYEKINLTVRKFIRHMIDLEKVKQTELDRYYKEYYLESMLDTPMKYLSKGTLQKIAVIQALICERDLLFMDEPLSGQDANSKAGFAAELRRRKSSGMSIVMACHEPYLVEELADNMVQIKNGQLQDGSSYLFSQTRSTCQFIVDYSGNAQDFAKWIENDEIRKGLSVSGFGSLFMLKAERLHAGVLFRILLDKNVRIVKYEESESEQPC